MSAAILQDERVKWIRQRVLLALDVPAETFDDYFSDTGEKGTQGCKNLSEYTSSKHTIGSSLLFSVKRFSEEDEFTEMVEEEVVVFAEPAAAAATSESADGAEKPAEAAAVEGEAAEPAPQQETVTEKRMVPKKVMRMVHKIVLIMSCNFILPEMHDLPTCLFIRSQDGDVPLANNSLGVFNEYFEFSMLNNDVLYSIANIMSQVYFSVMQKPNVSLPETGLADVDEGLRHELSSNLTKFEHQLRHVVNQTRGDIRLNIPAVNLADSTTEQIADDFEIVDQISTALEEWTVVIAGAVEAEHQKVNKHRSPLDEIEFWRERTASLSALYEQINLPKVQQMLAVLKHLDNPQIGTFNFHFGELTKLYVEGKDNVKFLTTLERHFKHLVEGSFSTILDAIPSMVNGLRMVWVISRHYNTDERMAPLMENIAETLSRRVKDEIKLSEVLAMDAAVAKQLISEAKAVLEAWNEHYFRMRKKIEDSGSDHRWEFDRKALFGSTDYKGEVCGNLIEIVSALDHFRKFLGPELKAVTGDSAGIDEVLKRVDNLTLPLKVPFEEKIFDKSFERPWEIIMKKFRNSVLEIEKMTESFIKESFRKLRSAEGAFELVKNFQKIGMDNGAGAGSASSGAGSSTPAASATKGLPIPPGTTGGAANPPGSASSASAQGIKQQISERYKDILEQYLRELEAINNLFVQYKDKPQIYKNYPSVAGTIAWARDLYHRAKRPIVRFKKHGGLLESDFGETVKNKYLQFARSVDNFISELYNDWEVSVTTVALEKLRMPVLKSIAPGYVHSHGEKGKSAVNQTSENFVLPPPPYRVSFSSELKMIIRESKYLDKLGFHIPENALNVTLQESKYQGIVRTLSNRLHEYDRAIASLKPIEKQLLAAHIDNLNSTIKIGFYPLNWTSQRIPQYIEDLEVALSRFSNTVSQLQKNATMIEDIIEKIANTLLVQGSDFKAGEGQEIHAMDVSEFYERLETRRTARLDALVHEYKSIGESFLLKVEEIVATTTTGDSPVLAAYYHFWEKCIYNGIAKMILRSMSLFQGMLQCKEHPPLFRAHVTLNGKELVVTPTLTDIDKLVAKCVRNLGDSARFFVRWKHGTCIRCEPVTINDDDEPFIFSFYQDIAQNPQIVKLTLSIGGQTNKVFSITNKYLDGWRRYDKVTNLWNPKRKQQIEKLRPTCSNLDQAMNYFHTIAETVEAQCVVKEIDFLSIDMTNVAHGVARQAELWKTDYGEVLHNTSRDKLNALLKTIAEYEEYVVMDTDDLDSLKFVLNAVNRLQNMMQEVELEMVDIIERYRTLQRYHINCSDGEMTSALEIEKRWRKLYVDSRTRDLRLIDTKAKFREVTAEQDIKFRDDLSELRKSFLDSGPGVSSVTLDEGVELMAQYKKKLAVLHATKLELINAQNLFSLPVKPYPALSDTQVDMEKLDKIYSLYISFREFQENMASLLWNEIDIANLQKGAEDFEKLAKKFPKELKEIYTFKMVENKLSNFKEALPLIVSLKNDAMKPRHWMKLMEVTKVTFDVTLKSLTLSNIFAMELYRFTALIEEIINEAAQEAKIENELNKIDAAWRTNSLSLMKYKKDGQDRGYILRPAEEIKLELDDNMLNLMTIAGSRFVGTFTDRVRTWEKTLNIVSECLEVWFVVQRKWAYLEGIFIGAEDIRLQLPEEAKKFDAIDKQFKGIMSATAKNSNVVDACTGDNRLSTLQSLSERLDKCQKSLSDYLDTKRAAFPRFFFISDDELLSVLGSSDPSSIQVHLLKLFDNVKGITFGRNNKVVESMGSVEKEGFDFITVVPVEGAVEQWMTSCETEMHVSLKDITKEGVFKYAHHPRTEWLRLVLGMVGLVGSQIWWTWEVEDTFRAVLEGNKYAMKELEQKLTRQLVDLVTMVRQKLDSITRKKVNTLLIIDVHARDIVDGFVRESVLNAKEFAWESQLRFYWDRSIDDCVIKQCTGSFRYGYEYMGLNGRLVITPLTDRCYMTLTQALTFKLGGSPAGPAGTGKTETVKDLAKSLALPCFVINCGDGLDYKAMGSIFSGLVQVGAWGCFDEFNRINIEVLSVVSAQLRAIQNALIYDKLTCDIGMGGEMLIRRVAGYAICGFFVTMNPGYAGRTELPDNLKALFRPVTMIVPDFLQICEIMLFSEGFESAKILAKKMTVLYKLSQEQLSKQYHYDFGMRALKSVLVMAGGLKRQYSEMREDLVLMRCLRDSNLPKFVFEDVPLFTGLISDLFPGMDCPRVGYEDLKMAAKTDLENRGFRCSSDRVFEDEVDKCIQIYEIQLVRHTSMIVGPTGGGKSLILETLRNARLAAENVAVKMAVLNPKAQPLHELYGFMDPATRDWTDGILSKIFREMNEPLPPGKENEFRWIMYDGDVDALWVENMNSVMDDNRLLTLPNGERIRLQPYCIMIVETFDLQYASPATVSRCGMVWVDPKNLGYRPFYERWIRLRCGNGVIIDPERQAEADNLTNLFNKYIPKSIDMILTGIVDGEMGQQLKQVIPITNIDLVRQLCSLLDAFLSRDITESIDIESTYIFCIMWSLGAQLVGTARNKYDAYVKKLAREPLPDGLLYDYFYDFAQHKWLKWQSIVPAYAEPSPFRFYEVMVPTTDSVLFTHMLTHLAPLRPILFVGESGTAKTTIIQKYLSDLPSSSFSRLNINFSSRTSAADVQTNVEANVDKRSGSIYGPPTGKKLIVFIDDMNMPKVDTYGTQQPIALLLFLMGRGNLYDREKDLNIKTIKDLQYIGAMGPPGGGRNPVDTRFIALFNVFNLTPPSADVLNNIFSSIIVTKYSVFPEASVKAATGKVTATMLKLYNYIVDKMPPTPSKFHYIFNLRDLSRVWEGLCNGTPDTVVSNKVFVRLWTHECVRVFCDRLTTTDDQNMFFDEMGKIVKETFPDCLADAMVQPFLAGDFEDAVERIQGGSEDVRLYKDMGGYDNVRKIFSSVLDLHNGERKAMTLVLFEQALEHLCRIHRIIRNPRGNALLIGVGGSGKQSLTQLATYCAGYKLFQISLSRGYGEENFKGELKELYKMLGTGEVVFLFTDAHVVEEGFLEFINNMLTTGMVPALYEQDEKDGLCNTVRADVRASGMAETPDNLWSYYINKCRNNLHIVLAMSPSGSKLRIRCRNFPGLVSNTVIDWFFPWPADALEKVADYFLREEELPDEHRESIVHHLVFAHQNVMLSAARFAEELRRNYYVTPKNYLDFIANYRSQLKSSKKSIDAQTKRLEGGLQKLIEAAEAVDRMQVILTEKKVVVDAKTEKVQALILVIKEKTEVANAQQVVASEKQKYASEQAILITHQKAEADEALMEALPAVEAASRALENLDRNDLTELKAFTNPPDAVKKLSMQLVCLRPTGEKFEETWGDAKKLLGNGNLLNLLKNYPKDDINEKQMKRVVKWFEGKDPQAALDSMQSVSVAGYGLLTWVVAICKYYDVARNVAPLRERVKSMEKAQRQTEAELAEINAVLSQLAADLKSLNEQYQEASGELDVLQQEAALMTKRLNAASQLILGLTGERTRWSTDVGKLKDNEVKLIGDCLLGSSFLSYAGAFTADYRRDLIYNKFLNDVSERSIPLSDPFTLEALLTNDATVQGWVSKGLPADDHSVQNGILTTKASRFPLCIDPQQQAVTWIKQTYVGKNLTVKALSESDFMKHLELAIQFGNPFLFENIDEELDPMLDPVLEKNVVKEGASNVIKLGDKNVEWDDNFRLFFTTKLANPHYSPEIMGKTMIVNYGVTMDGLANQLLNVVVAHERPDLEKAWAQLVIEMGENAQLLMSLEDTLLRELSSSQGNILDNQELIATLENTKSKAVEISGKLTLAAHTKEDIGVARSVYKPVAKRGSILYFSEASLSTINSMYEISLDSFLAVFKNALDIAKKDAALESRLRNMIDTVTRQIYDYTCTGIFERHKLMFSFQMTCNILNGDGLLDTNNLDFFLKGDTSLDAVSEPCPVKWMSGVCWKDLVCVSQAAPAFSELLRDFKTNPQIWKDWYDLETPETSPLPNNFNDKLTYQQRLAMMRCFRPDRVYNLVKLFVADSLGEKYVQPPVLEYARIYASSSATVPMVFILSPGADPQSDIQKFAEEMSMTSKFKFVALGQGQGPIAEQLLDAGYKRGHWVLLQNCHLLASWLKTLEKILTTMKEPHKDFRLWLTTDPTDKFPLGILQRSLKVVTEPPDGLKLNMRATYSRVDSAMLEECPHWAFRPCMYVLAFLHAVVLERRKYGKIGWNVNYDFNDSDLNVSRRLLSLYLTKAYTDGDEFLPWGSLKYLIGDAMYGGRVSDDMDRRVLKTYLEEYMGDFLFDDCQKFSFSRVGFDYELPEWGDLENYVQMVENLPLTNSPAVFGLHPNAEIGYFANAVKEMWLDLISLQPRRAATGEGMSKEDYIANTAREVFNKIPLASMDVGSYDLIQIRALLMKRNESETISPCQVVLLQELERWNILVKKMAGSLMDLQRALIGEIGMSDELDALGDNLYNGFLPFMWRRLAPATDKQLGSWMGHYLRRNAQYKEWINVGEPAVIWLSGLHIPGSYLSALVQTACRLRGWPLDKSTLYTSVTKYTSSEGLECLETGCYVSGMYLEGAAWNFDDSILRVQDPKVLVVPLPIMQIIPIESSKLKLHNTFRTPVYVTQQRRNAMGVGLVFEADLATTEHSSHWVLQGVCLCLNIDD